MTASPLRGTLPILVASLFMALFLGAVAGLGRPLLLAPFIGLIGLATLFVIPSPWMFWSLLVGSMFVVGPVMYFGHIENARWLPPLLGLALYVPLVAHVLKPRRAAPEVGWPLWFFVLSLFLVAAAFSTALGDPRLGEVLVASRAYLAFWSIALALAVGMVSQSHMLLAWKALMVCAVLQLPVAIYQYFVVAKISNRLSPWDAVVGTFPGNMDGGGASHGMGIFLLVVMAAVLALWRTRQIRRSLAVVIFLAILATLALAEVKAAVLIMPLVFALVYYRELLRRPLLSVGAVVISVGLMGTLLAVYENTFYANRGMTLSGKLPTSPLAAVQNQLNPEQMHTRSEGGVIVSRAARMADWWQRNVRYGDPYHALLGYGVGATQLSTIGMGELVTKMPYSLDMTGTAILLWETGLVGHLLLVLALLLAARNCNTSVRSNAVPAMHKAMLEAASAGLVLYAVTLPYSNFALRAPPSQFLMVFLLGYSAYWWRITRVAQFARAGRSEGAVHGGTPSQIAAHAQHQTPRYSHG
ncbi:hypothetical protein [Azohydromonas caseinilytica]|uniref:Uncharacterized protein n=1 Tax=Azohydromonas caseinilytica TaxID=2728836 RepID=A0A848FDJ5_9BURK|nr:hypothetical protein [Azohydromonas caseinilytica]NML17524.1 hypothetical protein [Azohydromonas caseinilytica]